MLQLTAVQHYHLGNIARKFSKKIWGVKRYKSIKKELRNAPTKDITIEIERHYLPTSR